MPEDQDSQLLSIKNATKKNAKGYLTYRTGTKPFVLPNYLIIPRQHYAGIVFWENASLFQALVVEDERKNAFFHSARPQLPRAWNRLGKLGQENHVKKES